MSGFDRNISMSHRWFNTIKKDYSDWHFAWAREAGQNSLDAGATRINISVRLLSEGNTSIVWHDNGCGMDEQTLESKFMAIGGSEKPNGGTGGFGIAKLILAFAQKDYSIRSRDILAEGSGAAYRVKSGLPPHGGLTLSVTMEGDCVSIMKQRIRHWVRFTTTKCEIVLNGETLPTLRMGRARKETPWCKVYVNKGPEEDEGHYWGHYIRVRMNRQFMFKIYTSVSAHVTVDILGTDSQEYLTSNRDGMNWTWRAKLEKLVEELFENPNKIKEAPDHVTLYCGRDGVINLNSGQRKKRAKIALGGQTAAPKRSAAISAHEPQQSTNITGPAAPKSFEEVKDLIDGYDLLVVNKTNKEIPERFLPGQMKPNHYKTMNRWIRIVQTCGEILGRTEEVRVGWVFAHDARAMWKYHNTYGNMILVNPVTIRATRFINYWKGDKKSFYEMVAVAIHELVHIDRPNHNEGFAADITYALGKVMAQLPTLEKVRKETR